MDSALIALSLLVVLVGVALWASGSEIVFERRGVGIVEAMPGSLAESFLEPSEVLTLFSCHLGYGLGDGRVGAAQTSEAVYDRLDLVIDAIAASDADAAMLQAVDFASSRTGFIPQLHYVAAALGWGYVAAITTWECRYLPLPLSHAGRVRAGQGIISRLPLEHNSWHRLSPTGRGILSAGLPFAPREALQVVDMRCGVRGVRLVQAQLTSRYGDGGGWQQQELLAVARGVAMPSCVVTGVDRQTAETIGRVPGLRATAGDVLLGNTWSHAEVRVLPPLAGVSAQAPVLVKLKL